MHRKTITALLCLAGLCATLAGCDGTTTAALTERTTYSGTYTYAPAAGFNPATVNPGTYGAVVTYTATTP